MTRGTPTKSAKELEKEKEEKLKKLLDPNVKPEYLNQLQLTADDESERSSMLYKSLADAV